MSLNVQNVDLRISAGLSSQVPADPIPQVAFSGRSNVGKSSLINALLGRKKLARVSGAPGKTITINFYEIDRKLFFVDLPGYGFARRAPDDKAQWSKLTDGYFTENRNIDRLSLVLQLVDSRVGPTADDAMMIDYLNRAKIPYLLIGTKSDKLNVTEHKKSLEALTGYEKLREGTPVILFSAESGEGKAELWRAISAYSGVSL